MKAERRHELKENDLAHAMKVAGDYLSENSTRIGLLVVGMAVAVTVVTLTLRSRTASLDDAWRQSSELTFADTAEAKVSLTRLGEIVAGSTDDDFVFTNLLRKGIYALRFAQDVDSPPDQELNEMARGAFTSLIDRFPEDPLALGAGHIGLATVEENAFVLDQDLAHKQAAANHLRAIIDDERLSRTPFTKMATDRTGALDAIFVTVTFAPAKAPSQPGAIMLPGGIEAIPVPAPDAATLKGMTKIRTSGEVKDAGKAAPATAPSETKPPPDEGAPADPKKDDGGDKPVEPPE